MHICHCKHLVQTSLLVFSICNLQIDLWIKIYKLDWQGWLTLAVSKVKGNSAAVSTHYSFAEERGLSVAVLLESGGRCRVR